MKANEENDMWKVIVVGLMFLFFIGTCLYLGFRESTEDLYLTILKADADLSEISLDGTKADSYYDEAGYAYEDEDYKRVESNCRLARDYYFEEGQGYKKVKAELEDGEIDDVLIDLYIEKLELLSEITNNMYEACEYFEVAARYYETYFNSNVPYDDLSWDMAGGEMDMMNEKIAAHDNAVERYNNKLLEFTVELEKRLE